MKSTMEDFKITGGIGQPVLDMEKFASRSGWTWKSLHPEAVCGCALVQENL